MSYTSKSEWNIFPSQIEDFETEDMVCMDVFMPEWLASWRCASWQTSCCANTWGRVPCCQPSTWRWASSWGCGGSCGSEGIQISSLSILVWECKKISQTRIPSQPQHRITWELKTLLRHFKPFNKNCLPTLLVRIPGCEQCGSWTWPYCFGEIRRSNVVDRISKKGQALKL